MTHCIRTLLATAAFVPALSISLATAACAQTARLEIAAGPLDAALVRFADQTKVQILYTPDLVGGLRTDGLSGTWPTGQALARLLAGTGLVASESRAGVWVLRRQVSGVADLGEARVEDVVVTGSLIRGPGETPSPITVITRRDLDLQGLATAADALTTLPQSYAGSATPGATLAFNDTAGSNTSLSTGVNLRGLGEDSTLVLINGRRIAGTGSRGEFADLSAIPGGALDRVDVLLDGASALYGSDAVGGVVNVILKRRFDGQETRLRASTARGGAEDVLLSQLVGRTWSTGSALVSVEYQTIGALSSEDRDYTATGDLRPFGGSDYRSIFGAPGNIARFDPITGAFVSAFAIRPGPDGVARTPGDFAADQTNLYNRRDGIDLLPEQERQTAWASARQQLGSGIELSGDLRYSRRDYDYASLSAGGLFTVTRASPGFVSPNGSASHQIAYDFGRELGPTERSGRSRSLAGTLGAIAELAGDWQIESYGSWAEETSRGAQENQINTTLLNEALGVTPDNPATAYSPARDGYLTLFGSGSANGRPVLDFVSQGFDRNRVTSRVITGNTLVDGTLVTLPGGPLRLAAGANYRRETLQNSSASFRSGIAPTTTEGPERSRGIWAAFLEVRAPLVGEANARPGLRRLELSAAVRTESYSDFGSTTNPKVGVIWEPVEGLRARASWGTSFRAPSLTELFERVQIGAANLASPIGSQLAVIRLGGNPELAPEKAESLTAGFDITRPNGLRLGASYFDILFDDRIGRPASTNLTTVLSNPALSPFLTSVNPSNAADLALINSFITSPVYIQPGQFPATSFRVILDGRWTNTGELRTRGIDVTAAWGFDRGSHRFDLDGSATWILEYSRLLTPVAPREQLADLVGFPSDLRIRTGARWTRSAWSGRVGVNYVDNYRGLDGREIGSWTTVDALLRWSPERLFGGDGTDLSLGINNLFDTDPPFYDNPQGFGFDPANASILGRVVSLQLTRRW